MLFSWKVKKEPLTSSDEKIEELKKLLFPPLELKEHLQSDGTTIKFHVDYSADSNLDAALMDLQEGNNDEAVHKTLNSVVERLHTARRMLEAYAQLDADAKYIIVEDSLDNKNVEATF